MKPKRKRKNSKSVGGDSSFDYSSEDDEQVPYDVEIPTISTAGSEGTQDSSYSMQVQAEENHNNGGPNPNSKTENSSPPPPPPQPMVRALSWDPADTYTRVAVSSGPITLALTRSSSWVVGDDITTSEKMDSTTPPSSESSSHLTTLPPKQDAAVQVQVFHTPTASKDDSSDGGGGIRPASGMNGGNCNLETGVLLLASSLEEEEAYSQPAPTLYATSLIGATRGKDTDNSRSLALPSSMNLKPRRTTTVAVFAESGESAVAEAEESKREEETASRRRRLLEAKRRPYPHPLLCCTSIPFRTIPSLRIPSIPMTMKRKEMCARFVSVDIVSSDRLIACV